MTATTTSIHERAVDLHERSIVIDALECSRFTEAHFAKMKQGGITAANPTVVMPSANFRQTVEGIRDFDLLIERHRNLCMPVRTVEDIMTAKASGRIGLISGFQNAIAIEGDLRYVQLFHSMGVRIMQLTYHTATLIGDGCLEPRNAGLTVFGRAVVREMNRTGIMVDLAHAGERTALEAIEVSQAPVGISHTCVKGLVNNPRNVTDAVIRALGACGGVMGITSTPNLVCDFDNFEVPTLEHYLRQIDYVVNLIGADHVGIGMDYTEGRGPNLSYNPAWGGTAKQSARKPLGRAAWPQPYAVADSSKMILITEGLLARGYSEEDVQKILGGNWVRLFRQVWTPMADLPLPDTGAGGNWIRLFEEVWDEWPSN